MGDDSHTASLFPDADNIQQALSLNCPPGYVQVTPTRAPHPRLSLNGSALYQMQQLYLLIQGEHKRGVLQQALAAASECPIGFVIKHAHHPVEIFWSP